MVAISDDDDAARGNPATGRVDKPDHTRSPTLPPTYLDNTYADLSKKKEGEHYVIRRRSPSTEFCEMEFTSPAVCADDAQTERCEEAVELRNLLL